jgi:hypothetical protein
MAALRTSFEELVAVGYSPERGRLEATIAVKQTNGYAPAADPGTGSREYVRFYVDLGDGFTDAGLAAAQVYDAVEVPGQVVAARPLSYVVGVAFTPPRGDCARPRVVRVRAILSWQVPPSAQAPQFVPTRGGRLDGYARLPARAPRFSDYLEYLRHRRVPLPAWHGDVDDLELAAAPLAPLGLDELIARYAGTDVPTHRYALPAVAAALYSGVDSTLWATAGQFAAAGLDWAATAIELFNANGDTSYERLAAVGLDANTDSLVATVRMGRGSGYNGDLCTAGSEEYVAFWADWGDEGVLSYLGTAALASHDLGVAPAGGLTHTVCLALDPTNVRVPRQGRPARVRAVLSWGVPPSVTDPYALPYWGDAREAYVRVRPGAGASGPVLGALGGVPVPMIDPVTGAPRPDAGVRGTGLPPDAPGGAFPGRLTVTGTGLGYRQLYRVMVRNLSRNAAPTPVTAPFTGRDVAGRPARVVPGADGWVQSTGARLDQPVAEFVPGFAGAASAAPAEGGPAGAADRRGELWEVWLETVPPSPVVPHRVRLAPAPVAEPSAAELSPAEPLPTEPLPTEPLPTEPLPAEPLPTEPLRAEGAETAETPLAESSQVEVVRRPVPVKLPVQRTGRRATLVGYEYAVVDRKPHRLPGRRVPARPVALPEPGGGISNRTETMSESAHWSAPTK